MFPSLSCLSLSHNFLNDFTPPIELASLTKLDLSYNNSLTSLTQVSPVSDMPSLTDLSIRGNPITILECPLDLTFPMVKDLDLSSTKLWSLSSLDVIPRVFPALESLLTKDTPLAKLPSAQSHTIARIATIISLNFTHVNAQERQEAELYYRSSIIQELTAATDEVEERRILENHARWTELCIIHGKPDIPQKRDQIKAATGTLASRMTEFTFSIQSAVLQDLQTKTAEARSVVEDRTGSPTRSQDMAEMIEKTKLIPRSVSIYRLIGIVERLFSIARPPSCRLVLETNEFDPVGHLDDDWSVDEDELDDGAAPATDPNSKGRWVRREEELTEGRKAVGDWVSAAEARVRIERK